jgi:hypothetical protein
MGRVVIGWLVNPRAFEPYLDCVPVINVANNPTRFKHNPCHGLRSVREPTLGDFHPVDKDKDVFLIILVKLTNGFVGHGSAPRISCGVPGRWVGPTGFAGSDFLLIEFQKKPRQPIRHGVLRQLSISERFANPRLNITRIDAAIGSPVGHGFSSL